MTIITNHRRDTSIACLDDAIAGFGAIVTDLNNAAAQGHSLNPDGLKHLAQRIGSYRELIRDGAGPLRK